MEEKFKTIVNNVKLKLKSFFTHVYWVILLLVGIGAGFGGGYFYKEFKKVSVQNKMKIVSKDKVFIAVDEYQRFMIVEKETGNYTIFEDSIGQKVFSMYARNIWGQHNTPAQQ